MKVNLSVHNYIFIEHIKTSQNVQFPCTQEVVSIFYLKKSYYHLCILIIYYM